MNYSFVKPDGSISHSVNFDITPPVLSAAKGRWLQDTPPTFNPMTHTRVRVEPVPAEAIGIGYLIVPRPDGDVLADKIAQLAAYRYDKEVGGITLYGSQIRTDRESQAALSSAYTSLKDGLIADTPWKAANGWSLVTFVQIEPIATAVAAHVRGCFAREKQLSDLLTSLVSDPAAVAAYDITTGWPS